jgi:arginase
VTGELRLVVAPFAGGVAGPGMGAGARRLAQDSGLAAELAGHGWRVATDEIEPPDPARPEIARIFEADRRIAGRVRAAVNAGAFPIVLAGQCNSALGTVAGVGAQGLGVVWLDAHADFDTPDENVSGFFDVMALAVLTGSGWRALRETIPGFVVVPEERVVLGAVRDLEPYQRARLDSAELAVVPGELDPVDLAEALDRLRTSVEAVYLHVDLDAVDASAARANAYAAPGGPAPAGVRSAVEAVFDRFAVRGAALTAYDPAHDGDGRALSVAVTTLGRIAERAARQRAAVA